MGAQTREKTTKENNQAEIRFFTVELKLLGMLARDIIVEPLCPSG